MPNPIKQKFIDHMELYQLSKQTQKGFISGVRCLAKHYNTSPEHLSNDQVREYIRHVKPISPVSPISTAISVVGKLMISFWFATATNGKETTGSTVYGRSQQAP